MTAPRRIAVVTFGCKVNQYESACIYEPFRKAGWELVDGEAEVYVINTCTVTGRTDFKSRNAVRKAVEHKLRDPGVRIFVTGCYAQRFPAEIEALGEIDAVIDNQDKASVFDRVGGEVRPFREIASQTGFAEAFTEVFPEHARAFVKVQDGCDCRCAYCAVPDARGVPRSRSVESALRQVTMLTRGGFPEIVLGGVNLGLWGREWNLTLAALLEPLCGIPGLEILRLSSVEPQLIDRALLDVIAAQDRIAPHFHIPLQSGSDSLLAAMGRRYDTARFREVVSDLLTVRPDAALGFDVIVGLPGETDALFDETRAFLEELPFAYLHVFTYSKRPGTRAATMKGQVHGTVARERSRILHELSERRREEYRNRLLAGGTRLRGVVESETRGWMSALSDHYLRMYARSTGEALIEGIPCGTHADGLEVKP